MELLEVCLRTTYFQVEDRFYQQKSGMAMGSSLFPIIRNIFVEHFEQLSLDSAPHKPAMWLRCGRHICRVAAWYGETRRISFSYEQPQTYHTVHLGNRNRRLTSLP
jgi:hypothetical protein